MEKAKDFYSKNVADAIRQACAEFGISQEKLDIEVVETGSAGIFGLCRKRAHIRVTRKHAEAAAEEPVKKQRGKGKSSPAAEKKKPVETARAEEAKQLHPEKGAAKAGGKSKPKEKKAETSDQQPAPVEPPSAETLTSIQTDLVKILELMGLPSDVQVTFVDEAIQCQINGEYVESIAGPDGRTLDSMQYLLRKMFSQGLPDRMMIDLNAGDFRERRVEQLQKTAVSQFDSSFL